MNKKNVEFRHTLSTMPYGTLVKIVYQYSWRDQAERFIGVYNKMTTQYTQDNNYFEFGHPYLADKDYMSAGALGVGVQEVYYVGPVTDEEAKKWYEQYKKFHNSVLKNQKYDICEEDIASIKVYKGKPFFENKLPEK